MIGAPLNGQGGIASVEKLLLTHAEVMDVSLRHVASQTDRGLAVKLFIFVLAVYQVAIECLLRRPDVMHLHLSERGSMVRKGFFVLFARIFSIPVLLHSHSAEFDAYYYATSSWTRLLIRWILKRAHLLIALSESWARFFREISPGSEVVVLPNGVQVPEIVPNRKGRAFSTILFLGRMGARKGVPELIQAARRVLALNPGTRFVLAGDGDVENLRNEIAADAVLAPGVEVLGWVSSTKVPTLLQNADVLVLPSHAEGMPMAILEAMAWALPVVATPVGGIPELVREGVSGRIVPVSNPGLLADAITRLVNSEDLRLSLGLTARKRIRDEYSAEAMVRKLRLIYEQLAQPRPSKSRH